jgi:hypothetical protein
VAERRAGSRRGKEARAGRETRTIPPPPHSLARVPLSPLFHSSHSHRTLTSSGVTCKRATTTSCLKTWATLSTGGGGGVDVWCEVSTVSCVVACVRDLCANTLAT